MLKKEGKQTSLWKQKSRRPDSRKIERIKLEEIEYTEELKNIKAEIETIRKQPQRSVDADLLLAQLQMIVGEPDQLAEEFKREEIEARLEAIKKSLQGSGDNEKTGP